MGINTIINRSYNNTKYKVYAMVASAIASQFTYAKLKRFITAIQNWDSTVWSEAALGITVAYNEAQELMESGISFTSPAARPL